MLLKITQNNTNLGTITFSESNQPIFLGDFDADFKQFVIEAWRKGITRLVDRHQENGNSFVIQEPVSDIDPLFPLAFKEYLEREGYNVIEKHPKVEEAIRQLLAGFPDDNPDKKDILERLQEMSYLEQTAILEGLKQVVQEK